MTSTKEQKKQEELLNMLLAEVKELKKVIKIYSIDMNIIKENTNLINAKVSDLSSKVDLDLCSINITTSKSIANNKSDKSLLDKAKNPNIMSYFKQKYRDSPESLFEIIKPEELTKLFAEDAVELNKRMQKKDTAKTIDVYKAGLIYKKLFKDNQDRIKKLRAMKEKEESGNVIVNTEVVENVLDEEEPAENEEEPVEDEVNVDEDEEEEEAEYDEDDDEEDDADDEA